MDIVGLPVNRKLGTSIRGVLPTSSNLISVTRDEIRTWIIAALEQRNMAARPLLQARTNSGIDDFARGRLGGAKYSAIDSPAMVRRALTSISKSRA